MGLPPLAPAKVATELVLFTNVTSFYSRHGSGDTSLSTLSAGTVVFRNGKLETLCLVSDSCLASSLTATELNEATVLDLEGGSIAPGLVSFGAPLGLQEIDQEASTNDGYVFDPLVKRVPKILGGDTSIIRAVDGLQFATRDAL